MAGDNIVIIGGVPVDVADIDFNNRTSNVASVRTANITLIVLVSFFVILRLLVRGFMVRKIFADDVLIVVGAVFTIALASVCLRATTSGLGTHVWFFTPETVLDKVKGCIQYLYICQVLYACAIAFTKIAIIASYLRFVQVRKFRLAMYATAVMIVGLWVTGVFVTIFQCRPISSAWDFTSPNRKCIDYIDYLYASSAVTVATDIILCVLPWPYLLKLNVPLKQRVILCLLFGGGTGACVASVIRIVSLHRLRSRDVTYESVPCLNLSVLECSLGIICVSIPALRPLAVALFPKYLHSNHSTAKSPSQSHSLSKKTGSIADNTGNLQHYQQDSPSSHPGKLSEEREDLKHSIGCALVLEKEVAELDSS